MNINNAHRNGVTHPPELAPPARGFGLVTGPAPTSEADLADAATVVRLALGHRVSTPALRAALSSARFGQLMRTTSQTDPPLRAEWPAQWVGYLRSREPGEADVIERALAEAVPIVREQPDDPEPDEAPAAPKAFSLGAISSATFADRRYAREWIIEEVLVLGQPCVVGGPRKALKTSTMVDLIISIATGSPFLGRFEVYHPRRVLLVSGESGDATIQETAARVCKAKGLTLADADGAFWAFNLPKLSDPDHMAELSSFIEQNRIEVVVIDPLYLCLLSGNSKLDATNLFDVGPLLARITETCLSAGATPLLVHHLRKNRDDAKAPPELEDLAFAGIQEFARQWLLLGRRKAYEPGTGRHELWLSAGGSAGHSGAWAVDVEEGVTDRNFSPREWNVTVTGATEARHDAKQQATDAQALRLAEQAKVKDEARRRTACDDAEAAFAWLRDHGPATKSFWRDNLHWNSPRINAALAELSTQNRVRSVQFEGRNGRGVGLLSGIEVGDPREVSNPLPDEPRTTPDNPGLTTDSPRLAQPRTTPDGSGDIPPLKGGIPRQSEVGKGAKATDRSGSASQGRTAEESPRLDDRAEREGA